MGLEEEGGYFGSMQDDFYSSRSMLDQEDEDEEDIDKQGGNNLDIHDRNIDNEEAEDVHGACSEV